MAVEQNSEASAWVGPICFVTLVLGCGAILFGYFGHVASLEAEVRMAKAKAVEACYAAKNAACPELR